jgi:hypothetical protein
MAVAEYGCVDLAHLHHFSQWLTVWAGRLTETWGSIPAGSIHF